MRTIYAICDHPANRTGAESLGEVCGKRADMDGPYEAGSFRLICPDHGTVYWVTITNGGTA